MNGELLIRMVFFEFYFLAYNLYVIPSLLVHIVTFVMDVSLSPRKHSASFFFFVFF